MTNRTARFFVVALGFTLLIQLPAVLARYGVINLGVEALLPLLGLSAFGPTVAAIDCARREPGGLRDLRDRLFNWRVGASWYGVAIFGLMAAHVVGTAVYFAFGGRDVAWVYLPEKPEHFAGLIVFPIVEEIGWRGYALPRMQRLHGPVKATLLLAAGWAAWHLMMFLYVATTTTVFAAQVVNILVGSFVFTWVFNRTRGSLLLAILLHVGAHLNNPTHAMPDAIPFFIYTGSIAVVAVALLWFDKPAWRAGTPS